MKSLINRLKTAALPAVLGMLCLQNHGWCGAGLACPNSHDVDMILDAEGIATARIHNRKQKRNKKNKNNVNSQGLANGQATEAMDVTTEACESANESGVSVEANSDLSIARVQLDEDLDRGGQVDTLPADNPDALTADKEGTPDAALDDGGAIVTERSPKTALDDGGVIVTKRSPETAMEGVKETVKVTQNSTNRTGGHRAGFDAFMTGYIFAWSAMRYGQFSETVGDTTAMSDLLGASAEEFANLVYLGGKDFPLQVTQSCFAKRSKAHVEKWGKIHKP
jgi:target of EGR1 protein 1